jgi:hypothetical protein
MLGVASTIPEQFAFAFVVAAFLRRLRPPRFWREAAALLLNLDSQETRPSSSWNISVPSLVHIDQEAPRRLPTMRKRLQAIPVLCLLAAGLVAATQSATAAPAPAERYLHVRVEDATKGENVNVNVPLSMAETVLPAVNKGPLHDGRMTVPSAKANGIDIHAIMEAVRTAPDGQFVTVKEKDQDVSVSKVNGNIVVRVRNGKKSDQTVDATISMKVVNALVSGTQPNELDVAAAIRAMSDVGDTLLVTVQNATQHVRIWVDSRNTQD